MSHAFLGDRFSNSWTCAIGPLSVMSVCLCVCLWRWCIVVKRLNGLKCHLICG